MILVRHTRPAVAPGVCYGRTDLELADSFCEEARRVIENLRPCEVLVTSPLQRCRRLAEKIASEFGIKWQIDERLQEIDFGAWEGRAWSEISKSELDEWAKNFMHARPHGGESVASLRERSLNAVSDYRSARRSHIVVTHSGVIKATLADGDVPDSFRTAVEYGGIVELPE